MHFDDFFDFLFNFLFFPVLFFNIFVIFGGIVEFFEINKFIDFYRNTFSIYKNLFLYLNIFFVFLYLIRTIKTFLLLGVSCGGNPQSRSNACIKFITSIIIFISSLISAIVFFILINYKKFIFYLFLILLIIIVLNFLIINIYDFIIDKFHRF